MAFFGCSRKTCYTVHPRNRCGRMKLNACYIVAVMLLIECSKGDWLDFTVHLHDRIVDLDFFELHCSSSRAILRTQGVRKLGPLKPQQSPPKITGRNHRRRRRRRTRTRRARRSRKLYSWISTRRRCYGGRKRRRCLRGSHRRRAWR
jgi:hypothetical protein